MGRRDSRETKQSVSFRFRPKTIFDLKQRAEITRDAQTDLVERYINEGVRQDQHPLIHFREGAAGRRPAVLGSRLDVADVVTTIRQNESSIEATAEYLEVPVEKVEAAARYYGDYKDEVDELIERALLFAERERERWRRQKEAIA